jgi:hypothetical protein
MALSRFPVGLIDDRQGQGQNFGPRRLQILNHPHNSAKVSLSYAALFTRALWNYPGYAQTNPLNYDT